MIWEEFWHDLKVFLLTTFVVIVVVWLIFGFVYGRDKRRGQLKLGEIIEYIFRRMI